MCIRDRFDTDEAKAWLKWFGDNVEAGYFALNPTGDYWSNDFNAGLVASYLGSCAGVPYIKPDGFEYTVAPMVRGDKTEWYPAWDRGAIVFNKSEEEKSVAQAQKRRDKIVSSPKLAKKLRKKNLEIERYEPDINVGLTEEQIDKRISAGLNNYKSMGSTKTISQIIIGNIVTPFNILIFILI